MNKNHFPLIFVISLILLSAVVYQNCSKKESVQGGTAQFSSRMTGLTVYAVTQSSHSEEESGLSKTFFIKNDQNQFFWFYLSSEESNATQIETIEAYQSKATLENTNSSNQEKWVEKVEYFYSSENDPEMEQALSLMDISSDESIIRWLLEEMKKETLFKWDALAQDDVDIYQEEFDFSSPNEVKMTFAHEGEEKTTYLLKKITLP